jgi:hypothetical protein
MSVAGARTGARWVHGTALPGRSHYLLGDDPSRWRRDVPSFGGVREVGVLPGVDLEWRSDARGPEYRFLVAPGAAAGGIGLRFEGATSLRLDASGDLLLGTPAGTVRHAHPVAWQDGPGGRVPVDARFEVSPAGSVRLALGDRDPSLGLVVDPIITFATPEGGTGIDQAYAIARGNDGTYAVAGRTFSTDFPVVGPVQQDSAGNRDAFASRFASDGLSVISATYLGGASDEEAWAVATRDGKVWFGGWTGSTDLPVAAAIQSAKGAGYDGWVARLEDDGATLAYSTYYGWGGHDSLTGLAVHDDGTFTLGGSTQSINMPVVSAWDSAKSGSDDLFLARLDAAGTTRLWSTYIGGSSIDILDGMAVDSAGRYCLAGHTASTDFPMADAVQPVRGGGTYDGFLMRFRADGSGPETSTYLGGSDQDWATAVAVNASGSMAVVGWTYSTNFPVTAGTAQPARGGGTVDAFVARYADDGKSLVFCTYLGGTFNDFGYAAAINSAGEVYAGGMTQSPDFPLANPIQSTNAGTFDAFLTRFAPDGASYRYSTFYGGTDTDVVRAVALQGNSVVAAGETWSPDFPTVSPVQATQAGPGNGDAILLRYSDAPRAPLELTGVLTYMNRVRLSWTPGDDLADGFRVERRIGGGPWAAAGTVAGDVTSFEDAGLPYETLVTWRVVPFNDEGDGPASPTFSLATLAMLPAAPTDFLAVLGLGPSVHLTWTDNAQFETGYQVLRSVDGGPFQVVATLPPDTEEWWDYDVQRDRVYLYIVVAVNEFGLSEGPDPEPISPLASISVSLYHGKAVDGSKARRDRVLVKGRYSLNRDQAGSGAFRPWADGFEVRLGPWASAPVLSIPKEDPGWVLRVGRATWRSPKGAVPHVKVDLRTVTGKFLVRIRRTDLDGLPENPVGLRLRAGANAGSREDDWDSIRRGRGLLFR